MREKWGLRKKHGYISWLGRHTKVTSRTNTIKLDERKSIQKPSGDDIEHLRVILPNLQLDMALVLVLVQDSSSEHNFGAASSQNTLAPSTPWKQDPYQQ